MAEGQCVISTPCSKPLRLNSLAAFALYQLLSPSFTVLRMESFTSSFAEGVAEGVADGWMDGWMRVNDPPPHACLEMRHLLCGVIQWMNR